MDNSADQLTPEIIQKIRRIEIRTRRLVNDSFAGEYHAVFKGRGMEFDEARQYQHGDEVRTIDWKVSARTGQLFVKRYIEERELTVMLVVDLSASGQFGTVDRFKRAIAAELAAALSFCAITNNDKVGLLIFTDRVELYIPPRKGRRHVLRLIRELLAFEPDGRGTDIKLALDTINLILKRKSIIFLVSDFLVPLESYYPVLQVSNRRHDLIAVTLSDPGEHHLPKVGILTIQDAETGEIQEIDTSNPRIQREFARTINNLMYERERLFRRAKIDQIDVTTDQDYVTPLMDFFERRARRLRH